jgi:AraC-like DNA-binding protein
MQYLIDPEHADHDSTASGRGPGCLAALLKVARRHGVSSSRVLARTGLSESDLAEPGCVVARDAEHQAIDNLVTLCGDMAGLGLEVGAECRFTTLGPLGFAMVSSPSLEEATRLVLDYADLFDPFVTLHLQGDEARFGLTVRAGLVAPALGRFVMERAVSALLSTWRGIARRPVTPLDVAFTFARPATDEPYARMLGVRAGFSAAQTRLSMDVQELALPLPHADAYAVRAAEEQCRLLRSAARVGQGVAGRVRALVHAHPDGLPEMEQVAASLCLSVRTLRRRLQKEGTTYAALCDAIRESTAERLLSHRHLPIEHIAGRLGYAEPSSFIQAFKRWKGCTPGAFRSAALSTAAQ